MDKGATALTRDELDDLWHNPEHWNRDGSYRCAADPRLIIPKRDGGGWTLNVGHPRAWMIMAGCVVLALALVGTAAWFARTS